MRDTTKFPMWIAALLFGALVAAAAPVALADEDEDEDDEDEEGSNSGHGSGDKGKAKDRDDDDDDESDDEDEDGRGHGEGRKPGRFQEDEGTVDGRFVDFTLDRDACVVSEYRVENVSWLASVDLSGPCEAKDKGSGKHGASMKVESDDTDSEIRIHDNPTGLIRFETDDDAAIVFVLANGVEGTGGGDAVDLRSGNRTARLFLTGDDGALSFDNDTVSVVDGKGNFLVHPAGNPDSTNAIHEAVKQKHVGGQIDVIVDNDTVVSETLAFDDVIIKVSKKDDSTFRFLVDANLTQGRVFVVNFAPGAFKHDDVGVRYFDLDNTSLQTEVLIQNAANLTDVLNIEDGEGPEFWIISDEDGKHVLVAVPSWSVHAFEVSGAAAGIVVIAVYGIAFGVAFAVASAVVMFLGRRKPAQ